MAGSLEIASDTEKKEPSGRLSCSVTVLHPAWRNERLASFGDDGAPCHVNPCLWLILNRSGAYQSLEACQSGSH